MSTVKALFDSMWHPAEIAAMFKIKWGTVMPKCSKASLSDPSLSSWEFCYAALNKVSRSFAVVIQQLPDEVKDAICIFYLVLRGLDTVEDDMAIPNAQKLPMLKVFHTHLTDAKWNIDGIGYKDEKTLLQKFQHVTIVHQSLKPAYQAVISEICERMAGGMCDFAERKVRTIADYNLYCHYVAGLVGIGLSRIFSISGLESPQVAADEHTSNSMGLFLQKTNIIRDYLEDLVDERPWWPHEIWQHYASDLGELKNDDKRATAGLACLNHFVANALEHIPDVLSYMSRIRDPKIFRFCAIPQVMAIATLAELTDNQRVFRGVVKIRKGLGARLMLAVKDMSALKMWFRAFGQQIRGKLREEDGSTKRIRALLDSLDEATADVAALSHGLIGKPRWAVFSIASTCATAAFALSVCALFAQRRDPRALVPYASALGGVPEHSLTLLLQMVLLASTVYLLAFVGVHMVPKKAAAKTKTIETASPASSSVSEGVAVAAASKRAKSS